jgi:hypothetical protein
VGKSWASTSPRLQPVWRPPQAPWRRLGGVSHRLDTVVRKLDTIPSLLREAWDAGRSGRRAEARGRVLAARMRGGLALWIRGT